MNRFQLILVGVGCFLSIWPPLDAAGVAGAEATVRTLAERKDLRLSADENSAAEQFTFVVDIIAPGIDPTRLRAERNNRRLSMICASPSGPAYFYATSGLIVKLDSTLPGRLLAVEGAEFRFIFEGDEEGRAYRFNISLNAEEASRIVFDPASILRSMLPSLTGAEHDPENGDLIVHTQRATVRVRLRGDPGGKFPLESMAIEVVNGPTIRVREISLTLDPQSRLPMLTTKHFDSFDMAKRIAPWTAEDAKRQKMMPPAGFWNEEQSRTTGEALAALVQQGATTRPADEVHPRPEMLHDAHAPVTAAELAKHLREQVGKALRDEEQVALALVDLTPEQRARIQQLIVDRLAIIHEVGDRVDDGSLEPAEALRQASNAVVVAEKLRDILTPPQFVRFARDWLAGNRASDKPDHMRNILAVVLEEAEKLELSELQRTELSRLSISIIGQSDALRRAIIMKTVGLEEVRSESACLTKQLNEGLKRILSAEEYAKLEKLIAERVTSPPSQHDDHSGLSESHI